MCHNYSTLKIIITTQCFLICIPIGKGVKIIVRCVHLQKEAGALERVELDACRQQLELERNRSQTLQQRLMGNPVCPCVFLFCFVFCHRTVIHAWYKIFITVMVL